MKLIDKDALVAEIERRKQKLLDHIICESDKEWAARTAHQMNKIIHFLDTIEVKEVDKEPVSERFVFKAIPRLLEMIEPTDRAKVYVTKLADALEVEGYSTDAKIVMESLKIMNGEKVPMATMANALQLIGGSVPRVVRKPNEGKKGNKNNRYCKKGE